jgi:hypothetical protein
MLRKTAKVAKNLKTHPDLNFIHICRKVGNNNFIGGLRRGSACGFDSAGSGGTGGRIGTSSPEKLGLGSCTSATTSTTTGTPGARRNDLTSWFRYAWRKIFATQHQPRQVICPLFQVCKERVNYWRVMVTAVLKILTTKKAGWWWWQRGDARGP